MEQQIEEILKKVSTRVRTVVLVDKNGLPIQSIDTESKQKIDPSVEMSLAGIAAAVLSLAESTNAVIDQGGLKQLSIKSEKGTIIILDSGKSALLLGIVPPKAGYATALTSLKFAASNIAKLDLAPGQSFAKVEPSSDIFVPDID